MQSDNTTPDRGGDTPRRGKNFRKHQKQAERRMGPDRKRTHDEQQGTLEMKRKEEEEAEKAAGVASGAVAGEQPPAREVLQAFGPARGAVLAGSKATQGEMSRPRNITPFSPSIREGEAIEAEAEDAAAKTQHELATARNDITTLYDKVAQLEQNGTKAEDRYQHLSNLYSEHKRDHAKLVADNTKVLKVATELKTANEQLKAEVAQLKKRDEISKALVQSVREDSSKLYSELQDAIEGKQAAETANDHNESMKAQLHERIDVLEGELKQLQAVTGDNDRMKGEIEAVHASLEDVFSDMTKDLSINEQLEYLRDQQSIAPIGRQPDASISLHEELGEALDNVHEHADHATQTVDMNTPVPALVDSSTQTEVLAGPKYADNSMQTVDNTDPVPALVDSTTQTDVIAGPKYANSSMQTVDDTTPVPALVDSTTQTDVIAGPKYADSSMQTVDNTKPVPALVDSTTQTDAIAGPKFTDGTTQTDHVGVAVATPEVVIKHIPIVKQTVIEVPVTPWWMWLLVIIGTTLCVGAFAGLLREREIWVQANNLAYQRLVGEATEGWVEWVGLGVEELVGGGGGLFG
ncbi:hypothetical protein Q7P37_005652 [Cladosporium fusiforme]